MVASKRTEFEMLPKRGSELRLSKSPRLKRLMHQRKFSSLDSSVSSDKSDDDDDDDDDEDDDDLEIDIGDNYDDSLTYDFTKFMDDPKVVRVG